MGAFYFAWWEKVIESRVGKNGKGRIGRGPWSTGKDGMMMARSAVAVAGVRESHERKRYGGKKL